jgi:hypothetical protein
MISKTIIPRIGLMANAPTIIAMVITVFILLLFG